MDLFESKAALILILLASTSVLIYFYNPCLFERDSVDFAEKAETFADERVFEYAHSPGYPFLIHEYTGLFLLVRLFGFSLEESMGVIQLIFAVVTIPLFFLFCRKHLNLQASLFSTALLSFSPLFLASALIVQSDISSLFFFVFSLLLAEHKGKGQILSALMFSFSVGIRISNIILLSYFFVRFGGLRPSKEFFRFFAITMVITVIFYNFYGTGIEYVFGVRDYARYKTANLVDNLPLTHSILERSLTLFGELMIFVGFFFFRKDRRKLLLLLAWMLPLFFYYAGLDVYREKYLLPIIPALCMLISKGTLELTHTLKKEPFLPSVLCVVIMGTMLSGFSSVFEPRRETCFPREFASNLLYYVGDSPVIACDYDFALRYYSNINVIHYDQERVGTLISEGTRVFATGEGLACFKEHISMEGEAMKLDNFSVMLWAGTEFTNDNFHHGYLVSNLYTEKVYEIIRPS